MSLSDYVDCVLYKHNKKALRSLTTCLIKAGGFLFGKVAPMVERWVEAPCGTGSSPVLPAWQFV